ncbi:CoxG family protein [Acetobacter conturbans]|uniref:Carbon monoxide dehydrogenase n=1 Tax=Acetobacter conturbans TaxID=1737472 RepID=A0ABX0K2U4_9PROT|nr:SRPBCC domain-containing protein [Acetobacter conturbans]NHN90077.1 carbon monoxide dehydrogenase [Acetobacter conturbans]
MKFVQEFTVAQPVETLWALFDQPETVAGCLPGIEGIEVLDADNYVVQMRQSVGPISATFESRVHIEDRIPPSKLRFSATGKAIRGAIGNFRAESTVTLQAAAQGGLIRVETEAALAGVLGSVGQKIIASHAEKIAAQFATNLETKLNGGETPSPVLQPRPASSPARGVVQSATAPAWASGATVAVADIWIRVAVVLMAVNIAIGLAILVKLK